MTNIPRPGKMKNKRSYNLELERPLVYNSMAMAMAFRKESPLNI
jgi:hypothetical protein